MIIQCMLKKHGSVKILPHPMTPTKGSKVRYLNFDIIKAVVNMCAEMWHAVRGAMDMRHFTQDFRLKAWVQSPGVDLGSGTQGKKITFFGIGSCCISY